MPFHVRLRFGPPPSPAVTGTWDSEATAERKFRGFIGRYGTPPPLCFSRSCNGAAGLQARYDCVPSVERMTWGVVSPGLAGAVGDADERPGHRPVRRNTGQIRGRQVCITWMREHGATAEAGTVNTSGRVRC
ncbi:hypothetical protein GCM10009731_04450 [Streptomyces globosus]